MRHSKVAHVSINLDGIGNSHETTTVEMQPETRHYLDIFRGREVEWKRGWGGAQGSNEASLCVPLLFSLDSFPSLFTSLPPHFLLVRSDTLCVQLYNVPPL